MKKLSKTSLKSFQKAILKDYGMKLNDRDAEEAARNLLDYMNTMISFNLDNKSKVLRSSIRTP